MRQYTSPLRRFRLSHLPLFACCICLLLAVAARAQSPRTPASPAVLERPEAANPEGRAELQRELERHAQILDAQSTVVKLVAKLTGPAVVHIETDLPSDANSTYGRSRHTVDEGSGVIIQRNDNYYVLTNRHVIRDAAPKAIKIDLADGRRIQPTKVLEDADSDAAVLAISAPDLVAAPLGDSDRVQIGDFVLAVGSPFGLRQSVTFGIISAKGRRDLRLGGALGSGSASGTAIRFQDFLQTDAAINPGNSGGPLMNLRGEIIGINTAIASDSGANEGIGFTIPANMFMFVARQLIETGKVTRAFLGVNLPKSGFGPAMAAELGLPRPVGARITGVIPNSPAEAARLKADDVILEFNHTPIEDDSHLVNIISMAEVGKSLPLLIFRDRKPMTVTVELRDSSNFGK